MHAVLSDDPDSTVCLLDIDLLVVEIQAFLICALNAQSYLLAVCPCQELCGLIINSIGPGIDYPLEFPVRGDELQAEFLDPFPVDGECVIVEKEGIDIICVLQPFHLIDDLVNAMPAYLLAEHVLCYGLAIGAFERTPS